MNKHNLYQGFFKRAAQHKMFTSKRIYAVLTEKLCNSKGYYKATEGLENQNGTKNGKFRYEMIREIQPEMELLEIVAFRGGVSYRRQGDRWCHALKLLRNLVATPTSASC